MPLSIKNIPSKCLFGIGQCIDIELNASWIYDTSPSYDFLSLSFDNNSNPQVGDSITFFAGTPKEIKFTFANNSNNDNVLIGADSEATITNLFNKLSLYEHFLDYDITIVLTPPLLLGWHIIYLMAKNFGTYDYPHTIANSTIVASSGDFIVQSAIEATNGKVRTGYHINAFIFDSYDGEYLMDIRNILPKISPSSIIDITCTINIEAALLKILKTKLYQDNGFYIVEEHTRNIHVKFNEAYLDDNNQIVSSKIVDLGAYFQIILAAENHPIIGGIEHICSCNAVGSEIPARLLTFLPSHIYQQCITTPIPIQAFICALDGMSTEVNFMADIKVFGSPLETVILHNFTTTESITAGYNLLLCEDAQVAAAIPTICEGMPCETGVQYVDSYFSFESTGNPLDFAFTCNPQELPATGYDLIFSSNWSADNPLYGITPVSYLWEYSTIEGGAFVVIGNTPTVTVAYNENSITDFWVRLTIEIPTGDLLNPTCTLTVIRSGKVGGCLVRAGFTHTIDYQQIPAIDLGLTAPAAVSKTLVHITQWNASASLVTLISTQLLPATGLNIGDISIFQQFSAPSILLNATTTGTVLNATNIPLAVSVEYTAIIEFEYNGHCFKITINETITPPPLGTAQPIIQNAPITVTDLSAAGLVSLTINGTSTVLNPSQATTINYGYLISATAQTPAAILAGYTTNNFTANPLVINASSLPQNGILYLIQEVTPACQIPDIDTLYQIVPISFACEGCTGGLISADIVSNEYANPASTACNPLAGLFSITVSNIVGVSTGYTVTIYDGSYTIIESDSSASPFLSITVTATDLAAGTYYVSIIANDGCSTLQSLTLENTIVPIVGGVPCATLPTATPAYPPPTVFYASESINFIYNSTYFWGIVPPPAGVGFSPIDAIQIEFTRDNGATWEALLSGEAALDDNFWLYYGNTTSNIILEALSQFVGLGGIDYFCDALLRMRFRKICCFGTANENLTDWVYSPALSSPPILIACEEACAIQNFDAFFVAPPDCNTPNPTVKIQASWVQANFPVKVTLNGVIKANNYTGNQLLIDNVPADGGTNTLDITNVFDPACTSQKVLIAPTCQICNFSYTIQTNPETAPSLGAGNLDGEIELTSIINGIPNYTWAVYDSNSVQVANGTETSPAPFTISGLAAGTYTLVIQDGDNCVYQVTAIIGLSIAGDPPIAIDDYYTLQCSGGVHLPVLMTDFDPNDIGQASTSINIISVTQPSHGTVSIVNNTPPDLDTIFFVPDPNFVGVVTFTYTIINATNNTATATVTVTILPCCSIVLTAPVIGACQPNGYVQITAQIVTAPLLGNAATLYILGQPDGIGTMSTLAGTASLTFSTLGSGLDITLIALGSTVTNLPCSSNQLTITVPSCNQPPYPVDDTASTACNTPVIIDVLANDTDDGVAPLTIIKINNVVIAGDNIPISVADGTVERNNDSTLTFTPNNNFNGQTIFNYTVEDNGGLTGVANVTVDVLGCNPCGRCITTFTVTSYTPPSGINTYDGSITFNVSGGTCGGTYSLKQLKENACDLYIGLFPPNCSPLSLANAVFSLASGNTFTISGLYDDGTPDGTNYYAVYENDNLPNCLNGFNFAMKSALACTDNPYVTLDIERTDNYEPIFAPTLSIFLDYYQSGTDAIFNVNLSALFNFLLSIGGTVDSIEHTLESSHPPFSDYEAFFPPILPTSWTRTLPVAVAPVQSHLAYSLYMVVQYQGHQIDIALDKIVPFCLDTIPISCAQNYKVQVYDVTYANSLKIIPSNAGTVLNPVATDVTSYSLNFTTYTPIVGNMVIPRTTPFRIKREVTFLNGCPPITTIQQIDNGTPTQEGGMANPFCFVNKLVPSNAIIQTSNAGCCNLWGFGFFYQRRYALYETTANIITFLNNNPLGYNWEVISWVEGGVTLTLPPSPTYNLTTGTLTTTTINSPTTTLMTNFANWLNSIALTINSKLTIAPATDTYIFGDKGFTIKYPAVLTDFSVRIRVAELNTDFLYRKEVTGIGTALDTENQMIINMQSLYLQEAFGLHAVFTDECPHPHTPAIVVCPSGEASFIHHVVAVPGGKELHIIDTTQAILTFPRYPTDLVYYRITNVAGNVVYVNGMIFANGIISTVIPSPENSVKVQILYKSMGEGYCWYEKVQILNI